MNYTEKEKIDYVEEFKSSKMYPYEFATAKGILISDLKRWLREYPSGKPKATNEMQESFGVINLDITDEATTAYVPTSASNGFKFQNDTITIELKDRI